MEKGEKANSLLKGQKSLVLMICVGFLRAPVNLMLQDDSGGTIDGAET